MGKTLRPYQKEAIDLVFKSMKKGGDKLLLSMATGTGKTATAVKLLNEYKESNPNARVIWGTHTEELVEQSAIALLAELELMPYEHLVEVIEKYGGLLDLLRADDLNVNDQALIIRENIGVVKADLFDIDKPIVIASMQTLWRRLDKIPADYFDIFICDECHLFGANTFKKSLDYFDTKLRLGLSATPYRMDGMLMGDIFDEIVFDYPIDKAIKDGYLCEIDAIRVKTEASLDSVKTVAGDLNQKDLEEIVNTSERNQLVVDKYKEYASGRQFLAFCVDVQHAMDLNATFIKNDIKSNFIVGNKSLTPDRKDIISEFKKGEYVGLTNCMVLTAGFDHPNIGCVIMASPTKSLTKYIQQVGRGTRLKNEAYTIKFKQEVVVLDIVDITSKHRLINTWTLDKGKIGRAHV